MELCGVILAGGKSSRMGTRKELLEWRGRPLIMSLTEHVRRLGIPCVIVSNDDQTIPFLFSNNADVEIIKDEGESHGPISGIYAAMKHRSEEAFLVLSCDLPFVQLQHLVALQAKMDHLQDKDAVLPLADQRFHPLFALYHRRTLPLWEQALRDEHYKMMGVIDKMHAEIVQQLWPDDWVLFNMNTPEEYEKAVRERRRRDAF